MLAARISKFCRRLTRFTRLLLSANPTPTDICILLVGFVTSIASGVPFPLVAILFGQLIDDLNEASCSAGNGAFDQAQVNGNVLKVVYIGIGYFALVYVYVLCWNLSGERLAQRLREKYLRGLLRQDAAFFDKLGTGEASSRLAGDIATIQQGTSEKVGIFLNSLSFFVTAYVVAFVKFPKLGGELVALTPAYLLMSLVGGYFVSKYSTAVLNSFSVASSIVMEALSNITVVHAFSANERLQSKFDILIKGAKHAGIKKAGVAALQSGLLYFIAYSGNALAFWEGSRTIASAKTSDSQGQSVGTVYSVIFILVDASVILGIVAPFMQMFDTAAAAFEKLEQDVGNSPAIDSLAGDAVETAPPKISGSLLLEDVSFRYPSRPDVPVLNRVNLEFPAGKHTALAGLSGSGKSTIVALAVRFYDPIEGSVYLDQQNIKTFNVRQLRGYMSLVQQDPALLNRSILENIALGLVNSPSHARLKPTLLSQKLSQIARDLWEGKDLLNVSSRYGEDAAKIVKLVQNAAELADASQFIKLLPYGYGTNVGSGGSQISGGQKQRISLARALIKGPKILILDEATSSLDSESERRILAAVDKATKGMTVISIAHRLSSIKNAHNIYLMRNGRVIESGPHDQLVTANGEYANLVRLQQFEAGTDSKAASAKTHSEVYSQSGDSGDEIEHLKVEGSSLQASKDGGAEDSTSSDMGLGNKRSTVSFLSALGPFLRPHLALILAAFLGALIMGASSPAFAVIFGHTISDLSFCRASDQIEAAGRFYGLMFFVLAIIQFFANAISWAAFGAASEKAIFKIRSLAFRSLLGQDLQWHHSEGRSPALLLTIISSDSSALAGLTGSVVGTLTSLLVNFIASIILTLIIAWKIALVALAVIPLILGAGFMRVSTIASYHRRHGQAFATSLSIAEEAVGNIKTVASLSIEDEILVRYRDSLHAPTKEMRSQVMYANLWVAIAYGLSNFLYALAYWWGSKRIIAGEYSQTQFFIVLVALLVSAQLWAQSLTFATDVSRAYMAVCRILNLIELEPSGKRSHSMELPADGTGAASNTEASLEKVGEKFASSNDQKKGIEVVFKQVTFAYPSRRHAPALRGLDFVVKPGEFAALVGPSGAGKSTIISLIERLYLPLSGFIVIGGYDIRGGDTRFRDEIALVPQEPSLFEGSVRFNVALGARPGEEVSDVEIEDTCRTANIHDTIMNLPQGYDTLCGSSGRQLSGGQRQRLAIARALVRKPRLLLLDESTSALDAESETLLEIGLERVTKDVTVIAIAHKMRTIKRATSILLIEDGACVDRGTHDELMGRSDSYRSNVLHQAMDST